MTGKVGVLVIHGMGSQEPGYSVPMRDEIKGRLENSHGIAADKTVWSEVYWADVLDEKQDEYFQRMDDGVDLDFMVLRKFLLTAFADAAAYRRVPGGEDTSYAKIHKKIGAAVKELEDAGASVLVVLAHSLGGHIVTNYIYDVDKYYVHGQTHDCSSAIPGLEGDFLQLKKRCGFVTFGCNIPMFTFAMEHPAPVPFAGGELSADQTAAARWLNYFDKDDVLGYPLKPISAAFAAGVSEDTQINVGGLLGSWNPISHSHYWTDNDFTKPVATYLATITGVA